MKSKTTTLDQKSTHEIRTILETVAMLQLVKFINLNLNTIEYYYKKIIYIIYIQIFNEKLNYNTGPRIDARKEDYVRPGGNVAVIIDYIQTIDN